MTPSAKLRGHAYFVELVGKRSGPPWWLFAVLAGLLITSAILARVN